MRFAPLRLAPLIAGLAGLAALLAQPVLANELPPLGQASYSADFAMTAQGNRLRGQVNHTPAGERREVTFEGERQVMILKPEAREMLMVMPAMNAAMRMPLQEDPTVTARETFAEMQPESLGRETVNGQETTVYRVAGDYQGRFWITDDGIVMRSDLATPEGRFEMELSNVARGPQDPALFALPAGIEVMDMGAVPQPQQ